MEDYKEMYFTLFRAMEKAVRILTQAQIKAEDMLLESGEDEEEKED